MRFQRPPATPLLGCAAILVDFIGLGMIAPILPGIVSSDAVGASPRPFFSPIRPAA